MKIKLEREKEMPGIKKTGVKRKNNGNRPKPGIVKKTGTGFSILKYFTGLTLKEWWQLRILKNKMKNGGEDSRIPDSTQKTITFEKVYRDGICKVRSGYYTKMISFDDLNYVLKDEEEQADILGLYSQFINYFEPGIHFQLFLDRSNNSSHDPLSQ